jgi:hypothetical protein
MTESKGAPAAILSRNTEPMRLPPIQSGFPGWDATKKAYLGASRLAISNRADWAAFTLLRF